MNLQELEQYENKLMSTMMHKDEFANDQNDKSKYLNYMDSELIMILSIKSKINKAYALKCWSKCIIDFLGKN